MLPLEVLYDIRVKEESDKFDPLSRELRTQFEHHFIFNNPEDRSTSSNISNKEFHVGTVANWTYKQKMRGYLCRSRF